MKRNYNKESCTTRYGGAWPSILYCIPRQSYKAFTVERTQATSLLATLPSYMCLCSLATLMLRPPLAMTQRSAPCCPSPLSTWKGHLHPLFNSLVSRLPIFLLSWRWPRFLIIAYPLFVARRVVVALLLRRSSSTFRTSAVPSWSSYIIFWTSTIQSVPYDDESRRPATHKFHPKSQNKQILYYLGPSNVFFLDIESPRDW